MAGFGFFLFVSFALVTIAKAKFADCSLVVFEISKTDYNWKIQVISAYIIIVYLQYLPNVNWNGEPSGGLDPIFAKLHQAKELWVKVSLSLIFIYFRSWTQ